MNRRFIMFFCLAIVFSFSTSAIIVTHNGEVIFFDNFEGSTDVSSKRFYDESAGRDCDPNNPSVGSWQILESDAKQVHVINCPGQGSDPGSAQGGNYLRIYRSGGGADAIAVFNKNATSGKVKARWMFFTEAGTVMDHEIMINLSGSTQNGGWNDSRASIAIFQNGSVGYYKNSWQYINGVQFKAGEWQIWELEADIDTGTFTVSVGGTKSAPLPFFNGGAGSNISAINFRGGKTASQGWFDGIRGEEYIETIGSNLEVKGKVSVQSLSISGTVLNAFNNNFHTDHALGLGTSTPQERLHVNGSIRTNDLKIGGTILSANGSNLWTNNALGLGISSPQGRLHVHNGNLKISTSVDYGSDVTMAYHGSGGFRYWYIGSNGQNWKSLALRTDNANRVMIRENGNVGIGTDHPQTKLDVRGNAYFQVGGGLDGIAIGSENGNAPYIDATGNNSGPAGLFLKVRGNTRLHMDMNGNNHFSFANNTRIVLGCINGNAPFFKVESSDPNLHGLMFGVNDKPDMITLSRDKRIRIDGHTYIRGTLHSNEIIVEANNWWDKVFDADYPLMSLDKLEQSIQKNKHLPGIPSQKQVMKNGIPVGKMQGQLLRKTEELTLYTIEQHKQIQELHTKNQNLQNKIDKLERELRQIREMLEK